MKEIINLFRYPVSQKAIRDLVEHLEHISSNPDRYFEIAVEDAKHDLGLLRRLGKGEKKMLDKEKVKAVIDSVKETIDVKEIPVRRKAVRILLNEIDRLTLENNHLKRITSGVDLAKSVNHWKARAEKAEAELLQMQTYYEPDHLRNKEK